MSFEIVIWLVEFHWISGIFNIPPGNKDAVVPNPLTEEESCRIYN